jgi:regulator of protease activity HflC (stomatin/prohibitin superfamily)
MDSPSYGRPRYWGQEGQPMTAVYVIVALLIVVALIALTMSVRIIKQYERVVLFELGKVKDTGRPLSRGR